MLRGELDRIVMKALAKDRDRRFETAISLARDIERYLRAEPVSACPPSAWYRFCKFARRNKGLIASACVVAGALVMAVVVLAESSRRVREKQRQTTAALELAKVEKRQKAQQLWQALVAQARAVRLSRSAGQRFESLDVLKRANALARVLKLPDESFHELRNAVIAALALPDLHFTGRRTPWPASVSAFDFDERRAIYARPDDNGGCTIRRFEDDVEIHHLPVPGTPFLSRDGRFLAVIGVDAIQPNTVRTQLWQIDGAAPRRLLSEVYASALNFHRGGEQVALVYTDGSIAVFELPAGRRLSRLAPRKLATDVQCALHPTRSEVAVFGYLGSLVVIRDLRTGEVLASLPVTSPLAFDWHPDGRSFAVASTDRGLIYLYDRATLKPVRTLEADYVTALAFNHAGDRLAATGWGMSVELFNLRTGRSLFATKPMLGTLRFSPDDRRLAGAVQDGKLGIMQVGDAREYRLLTHKNLSQKAQYYSASVSPNGRLLVGATADGFGIWDVADGSELAFIALPGENRQAVFEPSGSILTMCRTGVLRWPVRKAPQSDAKLLVGPPEALPLPRGTYLDQSPDGHWLATGAGGGQLIAFANCKPGPSLGSAGTLSPDGKSFAVATDAGTIRLVDLATQRELAVFGDPNQALTLRPAFAPDGTKLIAVTPGYGISVWDLRLIRRRLSEMGLDWDAPPYPSIDTESQPQSPLEVEVRWVKTNPGPSPEYADELKTFRAEADGLLNHRP
jgi:WD40 repeat protein